MFFSETVKFYIMIFKIKAVAKNMSHDHNAASIINH